MKVKDEILGNYLTKFEKIAHHFGLDYYPIDFEIVPENFMTEISVYGLPVRMSHWSYGSRYIHQLIRHGMGNSKIFEVMFPGNPCHAYLSKNNSISENILVVAHVIGHADFVKNNFLFSNFVRMLGGGILECSAKYSNNIDMAISKYGQERIENILDVAIALDTHIDINYDLQRNFSNVHDEKFKNSIRKKFLKNGPDEINENSEKSAIKSLSFPEYDLLWLIANYAPDLEDWERDIFLAVRNEAFYFYPVFACQIMNEGWASYWHARLLRESDFIPDDLYIYAMKAHSDVVRPYQANSQFSFSINPYHLGFFIWENLIDRFGMDKAREICKNEDDFGFIRNYLTEQLAEKLNLLLFSSSNNETIEVNKSNINLVREAIISPKFNYGSPRIAATKIKFDGSLELEHDYYSDGRGLDLDKADMVLKYIFKIWKRPVNLKTVDYQGNEKIISVNYN